MTSHVKNPELGRNGISKILVSLQPRLQALKESILREIDSSWSLSILDSTESEQGIYLLMPEISKLPLTKILTKRTKISTSLANSGSYFLLLTGPNHTKKVGHGIIYSSNL